MCSVMRHVNFRICEADFFANVYFNHVIVEIVSASCFLATQDEFSDAAREFWPVYLLDIELPHDVWVCLLSNPSQVRACELPVGARGVQLILCRPIAFQHELLEIVGIAYVKISAGTRVVNRKAPW